MRTSFFASLTGLALAAALSAAGCGDSGIVCDPECPAGFKCTDTGCVPENNSGVDLAASTSDMAMACPVACNGSTPYCNAATHTCVPCLMDSQCAVGQVCKPTGNTFVCVPGCADDSRCAMGQHCCAGGCIDTNKDPNNCGGCGTVCGSQHSTSTCVAGVCTPGACSAGWGDCNKDPKDGCETNLRADPNNCTACGMVCNLKNAISGCSGADQNPCYVKSCQFGFDDCNGDPKDGCETSVLSDAKNCGGCGQSCAAPPNATAVCVNAGCQLKSCNQGFTDCNGIAKDGCESNTGSDVNNCGACGNKCAQGLVCTNGACTCPACNIPNAKTKCVNNQCVFDQCLPGWADCDGVNANNSNGCEINTSIDANNCAACGNVCPMNNPYCNMSVCGQVPPYPAACTQDKDKGGSPYVICAMDPTGAWIAAVPGGLCSYAALDICKKYNFTKINQGRWGGTCGVMCGYCDKSTCMSPSGKFVAGGAYTKFDGGGGNPVNGGNIGCTVHWECVP